MEVLGFAQFPTTPQLPILPPFVLLALVMHRIHTYLTWLISSTSLSPCVISVDAITTSDHPSTKGYCQRNKRTTSFLCCWIHHHLLTRLVCSLCQHLMLHPGYWSHLLLASVLTELYSRLNFTVVRTVARALLARCAPSLGLQDTF